MEPMNWRGRISVVLGVLVLVGLPMWYLRPHWIYRSTTELNLDTAHVRQTHYVLNVPVWWWPRPTFIARTMDIAPEDREGHGRWRYVDDSAAPSGLYSPFLLMSLFSDIERELEALEKTGVPPEIVNRLRSNIAEVSLQVLSGYGEHQITMPLSRMLELLEESRKAGGAPFQTRLHCSGSLRIMWIFRSFVTEGWPEDEAIIFFRDQTEAEEAAVGVEGSF
ncbi:MAG: hypothetical protein AAGK14_12470 [Verrucomicrobiota bacterium]